jgi:predicted transposase YdaD
MVRENAQIGFSDSDAIERAVDEAIKGNLLDGFFRRQKAEVIGMILEEFDEELYKQNVREDGYLEGVEEGISRGQRQKALEDAENFLREGIPLETISKCIGLPLEQVREIAQSISVKA